MYSERRSRSACLSLVGWGHEEFAISPTQPKKKNVLSTNSSDGRGSGVFVVYCVARGHSPSPLVEVWMENCYYRSLGLGSVVDRQHVGICWGVVAGTRIACLLSSYFFILLLSKSWIDGFVVSVPRLTTPFFLPVTFLQRYY